METHSSNGRKSVRVLVVDDHTNTADYLAQVLCKKEYTAIAAYSGEEALHVAKEFSPDALVADVMMPGMNGVELACVFAEKFPACRVVMMTANVWAREIFIGGLRLKVLEKPFDPEELFDFLASAAPESVRLAS